jgi:hypothetical protein
MAGDDPPPFVAAAPLRTTISDDNPDDSCTPNNAHDCPNFFLSCLGTPVTAQATEPVIAAVAATFEVSKQAAAIRLTGERLP